MTITDEQVAHLRSSLDRTIGHEATTTVMSMLTAVDVSGLATKDEVQVLRDDIRALGERMDHRFEMVDLRFEALDTKWTDRINAMDQKWTDRINAMDERWAERLDHIERTWNDRSEGLEHRIHADMFRAINRHLTFSVMAMAAVSGMFTWLAR